MTARVFGALGALAMVAGVWVGYGLDDALIALGAVLLVAAIFSWEPT